MPATTTASDNITGWRWPVCPSGLKVYDKYSDTEATVIVGQAEWGIPLRGRLERHRFDDESVRKLQQHIVVLTQVSSSPATIDKFTRCLLLHWPIYVNLLRGGPDAVKRAWAREVQDLEVARAGKTVLKFACQASAGPWRPHMSSLIDGLESHSKKTINQQKARIKRREKLLPVSLQASVTKVLDDASRHSHQLSEEDCEGLAALAMVFQHGVRPVQVLSLQMNHVQLLVDASGDAACIISFHAAKQLGADTFEIVRQIKPEWVGPIKCLHEYAQAAGRRRLFACADPAMLWSRVQAVCTTWSFGAKFGAGVLRHTSAQALADAGHSRDSIRQFLGHSTMNAATTYLRASRQQGEIINRALGASKLYDNITLLAEAKFVDLDEMLAANEECQIGGVVGDRLIAGIGLCSSGQPACPFNPVTSCYGCSKFMPSLARETHEEAVAGMRTEVQRYLALDPAQVTPASLQLTRALAGAQEALAMIELKGRRLGRS